MNKFKKLTIYLLLSVFIISLIPNKVFASEFENKIINEEVEYFNDGTLILGETEFKVLQAIENIPDETIASGSDSINRYFYEKGITGMATVFLTNFIRCRTSFRMLFRLSLTMSLLGCDDLRQELTVKVRLPR